jgi:hypothetical protein
LAWLLILLAGILMARFLLTTATLLAALAALLVLLVVLVL